MDYSGIQARNLNNDENLAEWFEDLKLLTGLSVHKTITFKATEHLDSLPPSISEADEEEEEEDDDDDMPELIEHKRKIVKAKGASGKAKRSTDDDMPPLGAPKRLPSKGIKGEMKKKKKSKRA